MRRILILWQQGSLSTHSLVKKGTKYIARLHQRQDLAADGEPQMARPRCLMDLLAAITLGGYSGQSQHRRPPRLVAIVSITAPIFLLIVLGFGAVRSGWVPREGALAMGRYVLSFALPALVFNALAKRPLGE
uniref:AEC family transporter n=1 Tax=uncultured Thiodictyon sp. TaxID=1846217 RepID=UPI0025DC6189